VTRETNGSHLRTIAAVGQVRGAVEQLEQLLEVLPETEADAVALVGDLGTPWSKGDTYRAIFSALGHAGLPAYWVPGPTDAPLREYLSESYNMELAFPFLHGLHGTVAHGDSGVVFAGMGGEIVDDPATIRAEEALLRYPGWEVEYRFKVLEQLDEPMKVFLFTTQPAHKGSGVAGSGVLAELIKTHRARVAIVAGDDPAEVQLGRTLVVSPGRLEEGSYTLVELRSRSVQRALLGQRV
jgi:Icc-related predicted phosphoesterase